MGSPLSYKLLPEFSREIGSSHLFGRSESCAAQALFYHCFLDHLNYLGQVKPSQLVWRLSLQS